MLGWFGIFFCFFLEVAPPKMRKSSKEKTLLTWRNPFFVLDLGLDISDRFREIDATECNGLSRGETLDQNLSNLRRLSGVAGVVQRAADLELLSNQNEILLRDWNSILGYRKEGIKRERILLLLLLMSARYNHVACFHQR